jgi:predicted P-loop ATPase
MYDNSTPNAGQTSSSRGNLAPSSKSNPCPVCGRTKDGDCRISHDGKMVLCHQNFDNAKTEHPDLWHFDKSSSDGRCGIYIFKENSESIEPTAKKPRAKKKKVLPVPIPLGAKLLRLPAPGQSPQPDQLEKDAPKRVPRNAVQITYEYSPTQTVVRYEWPDATNPKGHDKTYSQFHLDPDGKKVWTKGDAGWPAYRIDEVVELLKTVPDGEPVVVLMPEGEPNVDLARNHSIAGLTMQGSNWSDPEIQIMMEALRATGKNVVLVKLRDNDDEGIRKGQKIWLVARHVQFPCIVIDPRVIYPDIPEKGDIREILEAIGPDEFLKRLESEIASQAVAMAAIEEKSVSQSKPSSVEPLVSGDNSLPAMCKNEVLVKRIEEKWGERLRLNEMTQQVEMDGDASNFDIEQAYIRAAKELHLDIDKQKASDIVVMCARENAYSPVKEYLNSLAGKELINLESLAERYFGTQNPFHGILLKRTLIAAVARAFKPGCKVDTMCILQGGQGALKSTFWQTLAGETWFTDNLSEASEKDEKLKLRRYWILEFSEFETVYKRKDVEQLKAFLSSRIDSLRRPYGRSLEDFPRTSIFVGSTNRQEFLNDPTGGRRYWVIPVVAETIPIKTLEEERDRIWAAAVAAYRAGEQWWLTREEDKLLEEANKGWQSSDTWEVVVLNYLQNKSICTVSELFTHAIQIELAKQGKAEQMRLSDILRRNGWVRSKKRIEGKPQWSWEKMIVEVGTHSNPYCTTISNSVFPPDGKVGTEVGTPSNPYEAVTSDVLFPPVPTFLPKDNSNNKTSDGIDIAIINQTPSMDIPSKGENLGGNTSSNDSQNPLEQGLEGVPTSSQRGGNTSAKLENVNDEHCAKMLADKMRKALAKASYEDAAEVIKQVVASAPGVKQFFAKSFTKEEHFNICLLKNCGLTKGARVKYVGKDIEQYAGEVLTVESMNSRNELACLRPDGKGYTTWLKPEELEKL